MKEITVQELKEWQDNNKEFLFIDVREEHEFEAANLGAKLIPLGTVHEHMSEFPANDTPIVIHCRSGARSGRACQLLEANNGNDNVFNLKGGIMAYADQIDPSLNVS